MPQRVCTVEYSKHFLRQLKKMPLKVQIQTRMRILEFRNNENPQRLHDHALTGKYRGYRSINISGDIRALYREEEDGRLVVFVFIGSHSQLYG